jgi:pycsar effector protein
MPEASEKGYDMVDKIRDRQEALVERLDGKADRLLTILTIASGIVGFLGPFVFEKFQDVPPVLRYSFSGLLVVFFLTVIPMVIYVLRAVGPHTKPIIKVPEEWKSSVSFYGGICKLTPLEYEEKMERVSKDDIFTENVRQSFILAGIAQYKNTNIKKAMKLYILLFGLFVAIVVVCFIIFLNL